MSKRYSPSDAQAAPSNPSNRLHAVLSAGLNRGMEDARKGASSATSTALRGRNPRVIRLDPIKAEALRGALRGVLETGVSTRARGNARVLNKVKEQLEQAIQDQKITTGEVGQIIETAQDGIRKATEDLQTLDKLKDDKKSVNQAEASVQTENDDEIYPETDDDDEISELVREVKKLRKELRIAKASAKGTRNYVLQLQERLQKAFQTIEWYKKASRNTIMALVPVLAAVAIFMNNAQSKVISNNSDPSWPEWGSWNYNVLS